MRLSFFNSLITPGRMNWVKWAWTKHSVRSRKNPNGKRHLKQHIRDKEMKPWRTKWCLWPKVYKQQKLLNKTQELQKSSLITVDFLSSSRLIRPYTTERYSPNQQNNFRLQASEALNSPSVTPQVYKQNIYQLFPYSPQKTCDGTTVQLWYQTPNEHCIWIAYIYMVIWKYKGSN